MAVKIKVVDLEKARKKAERREKFNEKVNEAKKWYDNNREWVNVVAPAAVSAIVWGTKSVHKHVVLHRTKNLKDLYCYDRSLGHYWRLKRALTNKDWSEINRRKKAGEKLGDILESLKVLK